MNITWEGSQVSVERSLSWKSGLLSGLWFFIFHHECQWPWLTNLLGPRFSLLKSQQVGFLWTNWSFQLLEISGWYYKTGLPRNTQINLVSKWSSWQTSICVVKTNPFIHRGSILGLHMFWLEGMFLLGHHIIFLSLTPEQRNYFKTIEKIYRFKRIF